MIKIINKAFQVGNTAYVNIEEAQRAELSALTDTLVPCSKVPDGQEFTTVEVRVLPDFILTNKEAIMDILTTTPKSRPSARKANGGTKSRRILTAPGTTASTSL